MTSNSGGRSRDDGNSITNTRLGYKHIKSKDSMKDLVCHIIGVMGFLCREFRASVVAKLIKRELADLKSYFSELGFAQEPVKEDHGQEDIFVKAQMAGMLAYQDSQQEGDR